MASATMPSSSRMTCSASIGRGIQAVAPVGLCPPTNTVSASLSVATTSCTEGLWSASATR